MKYLKTFESYKINELLAGHGGAVHAATRNIKSAEGEEPSDKADEFSITICTNPLYKRYAKYNYKLKNVEFEKVEPKKGFLSKMFSGNSTIDFEFSKVKDNEEALLTLKLKGDKFILANSTTSNKIYGTIQDDTQADKFIKYLLNQSQWKDKLKESFPNIDELITKDSFK